MHKQPDDPGRGRDGPKARSGTEPATARSPLGLRLLLSALYTPLFVAGAVLFAWWASKSHGGSSPSSGELGAIAVICAVLSLLALADLTVVLHRREHEKHLRR